MAGKISEMTDGTPAVAADRFEVTRDPTGSPLTRYLDIADVDSYLASVAQTLTNKTMGGHLLAGTDSTHNIGASGTAFLAGYFDSVFIGGSEFSGTALADPNADRIAFWDDSATTVAWLSLSGLTITTTSLAVDAASTTAAGVVELATAAEMDTGTDTGRALGVNEFNGSDWGVKEVGVEVYASDEAVAVAQGTSGIPIPASMDGMDLVHATATVHDVGVTSSTTVQVRRRRAAATADMLTTLMTLTTTQFNATTGVSGNNDILTGDILYIDVDTIHSGTAPNGLSVVLEFRKP